MIFVKHHNIENVPDEFRQPHPFPYPLHNHKIFEQWFYENYDYKNDVVDRTYLPVFFTSYYVKHQFGKDIHAINRLQEFINRLDKTKKYFTIIQYDDNILNDISELDIKVIAMCGKRIDYPLPLLSMPHGFNFDGVNKGIFASFIGRKTHPIRNKMIEALRDKSEYFISTDKMTLNDYCNIMARSIFALCPRGYGSNSFRIMEAIECGTIPVYISDEFVEPHYVDFNEYGVKINAEDVERVDEILKSFTAEQIEEKQSKLKDVFNKYYTYEGNKKLIMQYLKNN